MAYDRIKTNDPKRRPRVGNVNTYVPRAVQDDLPGRGVKPSAAPEREKREPERPVRPPRPARPAAQAMPAEEQMPENLLVGRNPIREALRAGRPMEKLMYAKGDLSGAAMEIIRAAKDAGIVVQEVDRTRLDQLYRNHQGIVAFTSAAEYASVDDIFALAESRGEAPLIVIMDGVTDPHNLGAVLRSAECLGAHGVIIPERRAVGLTPAAVKTAAGAAEYVPVARVKNLTRAVEELKEKGIWVYAADMDGDSIYKTDLTGPSAIVIGSEGDGVSRLVRETCDGAVSVPMYGKVNSLNASVAAGILLSAVANARRKA